MRIELRGLDEMKKKLTKLAENAQALSGQHRVSLPEMMNPDFMREYTSVPSFEALIEAGGFSVKSAEDFLAIPVVDWEKCVRSHTRFGSWKEMQRTAGAEWVKRGMRKGL